jgi:outer membrane lipoprotein
MPFRQVMQNPDAAKGFLVIWGGTILRTVNDPNGNRIYILELPLNSEERPKVHAGSGGRFIARSNGFLDPQVYSPGRWVTLAGLITGTQTEPLERVQYTYPVLTIQEIHLWHQVTRWEMYPARPWGWGWGWGWYSPDRYWEWDEEH